MPLHVKSADVPTRKVVRTGVEGESAMVIKRGYGMEDIALIMYGNWLRLLRNAWVR